MPQIIDGKLIVRFDDYIALDPSNGKRIWNTPSEVVFGTPVPFKVEGMSHMFTPRGEVIRVSDGKVFSVCKFGWVNPAGSGMAAADTWADGSSLVAFAVYSEATGTGASAVPFVSADLPKMTSLSSG